MSRKTDVPPLLWEYISSSGKRKQKAWNEHRRRGEVISKGVQLRQSPPSAEGHEDGRTGSEWPLGQEAPECCRCPCWKNPRWHLMLWKVTGQIWCDRDWWCLFGEDGWMHDAVKEKQSYSVLTKKRKACSRMMHTTWEVAPERCRESKGWRGRRKGTRRVGELHGKS